METEHIAKTLVINRVGELLVIRRSKTAPRRALEWDLPGGMVEDDEEPKTAAIRETAEEVGLTIIDLLLAYATTEARTDGNIVFMFFLARAKNFDVTLSFEHDKFVWVNIEEAINKIQYPTQHEMLKYLVTNKVIENYLQKS